MHLLIVEDDRELLKLLALAAHQRQCDAVCVASLAEARAALTARAFDVVLVDLGLGAESGFDLLELLNDRYPATSAVVMSAASTVHSAIQSFEMSAFAFVQKPFEIAQLFDTLRRAAEHGWMKARNRRLLWELQTINEIADGIARSLEVDDILMGALQRLQNALGLAGGAIRLHDEMTGEYEVAAVVGQQAVRRVWTTYGGEVERPSEQVIATRRGVIFEDLAEMVSPETAATLPVRSAMSVPMLAGDELVGTLTVSDGAPRRFTVEDQRVLTTIASQIGVAVQNARLHARVRRAKQEWERTFDAIADPIAVFDARGEVLRGNAALADHVGRPLTALAGLTCRDVGFCGGGCPVCAVMRAGGEATHAEVSRADGQIFSVTTFPVAGGPDGAAVVQVAKNVTEEIVRSRRMRQLGEELTAANRRSMTSLVQLKAAQAQLLQAEKLSAIGQLVAGVAHELNNPLTSIIGYAQLLEEEVRESPGAVRDMQRLGQDVRRIAEESDRAAKIVRNLLAFARRQSAARAAHDPVDIFERTLLLREYALGSSGISLERHFERGLPPVFADPNQLQQALLNLVLNAEQAMRGRVLKVLRVGARFDAGTGSVELYVGDTGHGIESTNLTRIFDPFFTTRDVGEGTGLGLSICYGIVRDHGGQIVVDSTPGAGTTFSLLLPARVEAPACHGEVLIAHAEGGDSQVVGAALVGWGYDVATVSTTSEALDRYARGGVHVLFVDTAFVRSDTAAWRAARHRDASRAPLILMGLCEDADVELFMREHG
jgi:two-component system, NtrC family, sensor kinase